MSVPVADDFNLNGMNYDTAKVGMEFDLNSGSNYGNDGIITNSYDKYN